MPLPKAQTPRNIASFPAAAVLPRRRSHAQEPGPLPRDNRSQRSRGLTQSPPDVLFQALSPRPGAHRGGTSAAGQLLPYELLHPNRSPSLGASRGPGFPATSRTSTLPRAGPLGWKQSPARSTLPRPEDGHGGERPCSHGQRWDFALLVVKPAGAARALRGCRGQPPEDAQSQCTQPHSPQATAQPAVLPRFIGGRARRPLGQRVAGRLAAMWNQW